MKKLVLVLAVLFLASQAMAAVTISITDPDDGSGMVTVSYSTDGEIVRGFAFDLSVDAGTIIDVNNQSGDYDVHPGSVQVAGDGTISGTIVCGSGYNGTLAGLGTAGVTTEQGSLYEVGVESAPGTSGDLFTVTVSESCTLTIKLNEIRGTVLEDASDATLVYESGDILASEAITVTPPCCPGDIANLYGVAGADGSTNIGDFSAMIGAFMTAYPTGDPTGMYDITPPPAGFECADIANLYGVAGADGSLNIGDFSALIGIFMTAYPTGDVTGMYDVPCTP